jgi:hypothetical protein
LSAGHWPANAVAETITSAAAMAPDIDRRCRIVRPCDVFVIIGSISYLAGWLQPDRPQNDGARSANRRIKGNAE